MEMTRKQPGRKNRDIDPETLPNQARTLRLSQTQTLKALAFSIRTDENSLSEFELTGKGLGDRLQWALAEVLGVNIQTLLTPGKKFAEEIRQSLDIIR